MSDKIKLLKIDIERDKIRIAEIEKMLRRGELALAQARECLALAERQLAEEQGNPEVF